MSSYKAAIRPQQPDSDDKKYAPQVRQLRELFPDYSELGQSPFFNRCTASSPSIPDLYALLVDVNGDIQTAATRITDGELSILFTARGLTCLDIKGNVEQWGEVSRKKDRKPSANTNAGATKAPTARGDNRGARGGRGGRGGVGRGGAVTRGGRGGLPRGGAVNGHTHTPAPATATTSGPATTESKPAGDEATPAPTAESHEQNGWAETPAHEQTSTSAQVTTNGVQRSTPAPSTPEVNGASTHPHPPSTPAAAKLASKSPATSKMSWAQIARYFLIPFYSDVWSTDPGFVYAALTKNLLPSSPLPKYKPLLSHRRSPPHLHLHPL